ncbi:hypothetical protein HDU96_009752 [Phlyctochytrium bullatum]|nr:hypothetical protein HDU96_009752 [Phlyctochytrium bullatum]
MSLADLNQIYEQSRRLTAHIVTPGSIPQLERGLDQIASQTKKLSAKASRAGDGAGASFRASAASALGFDGGLGALGDVSGAAAPAAPGQIDSRTAYLLAKKGFDADKVAATLSKIDPASTFEPVEGVYDTDLEGHLRLDHENIVVSAVEESRVQTLKDCEDRFERLLHRDWERAKKRIFEELGQHQQKGFQGGFKSPSRGLAGKQPGTPSSGGMTGAAPQGDYNLVTMPTKNKNYAQVVERLNRHRLERKPFDLLQQFYNVAAKLDRGDVGHQSLMKCWRLLFLTLIEEGSKIPGGAPGTRRRQIRELEFYRQCKAQEEGVGMSEEAIRFRKMIIAGGKTFLQQNHWEYINQVVAQQRVQVGGMPSADTVVDAYVKLKFQRYGSWQQQHGLEIIDGRAPWAHLYYLLRSGLLKEALAFAEGFAQRMETTHDARFFVFFREFLEEGRITKANRNELLDIWNSRVRQTLAVTPDGVPRGDPFRAALYKIVGRCEMSSKNIKNADVLPSVEDYVWLQLMLIQEEPRADDAPVDRYALRDLARLILRFGAGHFSPQNRTPYVYFLVLLLCGEYERAVAHLLTHEAYAVDAIHFAVALAYYGVLRVPDAPHLLDMMGSFELVSVRTLEVGGAAAAAAGGAGALELAYLHFERLVAQYARRFGASDPVDAFHYLALICTFAAQEPGGVVVMSGSATAPFGSGTPGRGGAAGEDGDGADAVRTRAYTEATHSHIRDLLLESGIAVSLLGESAVASGAAGVRVKGEIERCGLLVRLRPAASAEAMGSAGAQETDFVRLIVRPAAAEAERRGRLADAVKLYDFAEEYDAVVGLLCRQLGDAVASYRPPASLVDPLVLGSGTLSGGGGSGALFGTPGRRAGGEVGGGATATATAAVEATVTQALDVLEHYRRQPTIYARISEAKKQTSSLLQQLQRFAVEVEAERPDVGLETLRRTGLVPVEPDMAAIQGLTEVVRGLDESVLRCLPQVLLLAMASVSGIYRALRDGRGPGEGHALRQAKMVELKNQARAVLLFSSSIQYRIPSDTLQRLNRLDSIMN